MASSILEATFAKLDKNNDGKITKAELDQVFKNLDEKSELFLILGYQIDIKISLSSTSL